MNKVSVNADSPLKQGMLVAGPIVVVTMLLLPAPEGLEHEGWRVAAVALLMALWWMTEAIPLAATALIPLVLFPALRITPHGSSDEIMVWCQLNELFEVLGGC